MLATTSPFPQYFDAAGDPLDNGELFFGTANLNPETNPQIAYWDAAGAQPAAQPIKVMNGYTVRNGTPANVYVGFDYSLSVRDRKGKLVSYCPSSTSFANDLNFQLQLTNLISSLSSYSSGLVGGGLIGFDSSLRLNYAIGTIARHVADEFWNPCDIKWNAPTNGSSDATSAIQSCINDATAAGAGVYIPPGIVFNVNSLTIPSKCHIRGAGQGKSILKQITGAYDLMHLADPGSSATFTSQVTIEDLTMQGTVAVDGFQEVLHLMFTQGASDVVIQRVTFTGMRGDGFYVGTGNERGQNPTQVRHNRNVRVLDCIFDGEVKNNRNGISVIDCDGFWCERSYFTRLSRAGMPGAIDVEPDSGGSPHGAGAVINNINITGNKFYDNAGAAAINVNLYYAQAAMTTPVRGINIVGNYIDTVTYATAAFVSFNGPGVNGTQAPHDILVKDNFGTNGSSPFVVQGVRGVRFVNNRFENTRVGGNVCDVNANLGPVNGAADIDFDGNTFYKVASDASGGTAVLLNGPIRCGFRRNTFHDCGKADNSYNANITLNANTTFELYVEDNLFYSTASNANCWDVRLGAVVNGDPFNASLSSFRHNRNQLINVGGGTLNCFNDYVTRDDWRTPALQNGWVSFGGNDQAPQFMKDLTGRVWLRGSIKSGSPFTSGSTILQIPVGFRPGKTLEFVAYTSSGLGSVQVEFSQGDLQALTLPGNALVSLNGLSWKAEG